MPSFSRLGLELSPVVFGCMGLPHLSPSVRLRLIHCAIDHGITSFDTAPLYGAGESERILGAALGGRRGDVQILTKCGVRWDSDHGQPMFEMWLDEKLWTVRKDSRPDSVRGEIEASLRRLKTETIDLLQVHQLDAQVPVEDVMETLERARAAGKVRAIGVSNYPVPELRRAQAALAGRLCTTQNRCNALQWSASSAVVELAVEHGIGVLAYEPLARGILAGKALAGGGDFGCSERALRRVDRALRDVALPIAAAHGITLAQLSLAWLLARPGLSAVIAGASTEAQVGDNARAAAVTIDAAALEAFGRALAACRFAPRERAPLKMRLMQRVRRLVRKLRGR